MEGGATNAIPVVGRPTSEAGDGSFVIEPTPLAELETGDDDSNAGFASTVLLDTVVLEGLREDDWSASLAAYESGNDWDDDDDDDDNSVFDDSDDAEFSTDDSENELGEKQLGNGTSLVLEASGTLSTQTHVPDAACALRGGMPPRSTELRTETANASPVRWKPEAPDGMFASEYRCPSGMKRSHAMLMPSELGAQCRVKRRSTAASLLHYAEDLKSANSSLRDENARLRTILEQLEKQRSGKAED